MPYTFKSLKPENIILGTDGYLKLVDFGLSQSEDDLKKEDLVGTLPYMSPEILKQSGHSFETDFWSLGVVIYEMVTGQLPFYCEDAEALKEKIKCKLFR